MSFLPARGWFCLMNSKRGAGRPPDSSQAPCASQLVLTVQNAEPQEALAVKGASNAPSKNIRFILSPEVVVSHCGRERRRACAEDDADCACMCMLNAEGNRLAGYGQAKRNTD